MKKPAVQPLKDALASAMASEPVIPVDASAPAAASEGPPPPWETAQETNPPEGSSVEDEKPSEGDKSKDELKDDANSIRRMLRSSGRVKAWAVARALGWDEDAFRRLADAEQRKAEKAAKVADKIKSDDAAGGIETPAGGERRPGADASGDGGHFKKRKDPIAPLPEDAPVRPLGTINGLFYFLNPNNELIEYKEKNFGANGLRILFAGKRGQDFLWATWPKYSAQTGLQTGFDAGAACDTLIAACGDRGPIDALSMMRGHGAWMSEDGRLVLHCGDAVYFDGEWRKPDEYAGHIYPARAATVRPAKSSEGVEQGIGEALTVFDTWRWRAVGEDDAGSDMAAVIDGHKLPSIVMIGWAMAAAFGGALSWRPHIWITGDWGGGKSTLLDFVGQLLGGDMVKSPNATSAGVWSVLGPSTRPVLLDEVENDPNSMKNKNLIQLAREAASGGVILRGSSDHKSASFQARSAFLFSSIIHPPMHGQDMSRFAMFDLMKMDGVANFRLDAVRNGQIGRMMRARVLENWARWGETLDAWMASLAAMGHGAREQKQYGTLLAMYDMARWRDCADSDTRSELCSHFPVSHVVAPTNAESFLQLLLTTPLAVRSGGQMMQVQKLLSIAKDVYLPTDWNQRDPYKDQEPGEDDRRGMGPDTARDFLESYGIYLMKRPRDDGPRVCLPNQHESLRRLMERSEWRGDPGTPGGWAQAMRRLANARPENSRKVGGRGWSAPLGVFLMDEEKQQ